MNTLSNIQFYNYIISACDAFPESGEFEIRVIAHRFGFAFQCEVTCICTKGVINNYQTNTTVHYINSQRTYYNNLQYYLECDDYTYEIVN